MAVAAEDKKSIREWIANSVPLAALLLDKADDVIKVWNIMKFTPPLNAEIHLQSYKPEDEILKKMTDGRFRHMPVLEDGKLLGLISLGDVVKARLQELAMEKDALEGMIMGH